MTRVKGEINKGYNVEMEDATEFRKSLQLSQDLKNHNLEADIVKDYDENEHCGFGFCSPEWIQRFATKKAFVVVFSLLGVVQGMGWSYFTATISTLEKRFKISTQTAGIVMTGNEVSQILFAILLSHFGAMGHRPRLIALGVFLSGVACFIMASPHAFYGSGSDALALTKEYDWINGEVVPVSHITPKPGQVYDELDSWSNENTTNESSFQTGTKKGQVTLCRRGDAPTADSCDDQDLNLAPLILIFTSQFVSGIGVLLFFTLGGPYLDDNTKRKNIAMLFGITMCLRLVGPTFGFLMGSAALKLYVNPLLTPTITPENPKWIGAWWLGWIIIGSAMFGFSVIVAMFPRNLNSDQSKAITEKSPPATTVETGPKLTEIPAAVKLLLKNKVNILNNFAGVFYLFAGIGYWTYMPKYMETIFMQTASDASVISGIVGIFTQAAGLLLSGFLISRFEFTARKLAAWNVITGLAHVAVMLAFTQLGCDTGKIEFGAKSSSDGSWNLTSNCNLGCNCKISKILPVCYKEENTVFYSACHAGCETMNGTLIGNCSCLPDPETTVILGNCSTGCGQIFILFLGICAFITFLDATGRIGNMLISYRCVKLEERSLSIGFNILLLSALAMLPAPIAFGRIIDNVCHVWGGAECGRQGNCMLYDGQQLRYIFNVFASGFVMVGVIFDCFVCYFVKDLDLYKE